MYYYHDAQYCIALSPQLDTKLFPEQPKWTSCNGSLPRYRGYPCGLWMLMHTVTILSLPTHTAHTLTFTSKEALHILAGFVRNFFSCEFCRVHFAEMAITITQGGISHDGDAVLWLWEAHNVVNKRLRGSVSSDPVHPKTMFPSYQVCPFCYRHSFGQSGDTVIHDSLKAASTQFQPGFNNTAFFKGESLVTKFMNNTVATSRSADSALYLWNRTAVLLYLWNFYHLPSNRSRRALRHVNTQSVLHAAWPKQYKDVNRLHHKYYGLGGGGMHHGDHTGLGFNHFDTGLCVMSYIMCVMFMAVVTYLLIRKRRLKRLFMYPY